MAGLARRLNGFLSSRIPEKRLFLQTSGGTSYIRLTPLTQLGLGTSLVALVGWTAIATAAVVLDLTESNPAAPASAVIHAAYQGRLGELAAERDTRAAEANSAQLRFQVATDQIGRQQSQLLAEVENQRELSSALDLARDRLRDALAEKAPAATETGPETATAPGDRNEDLSQTLAAVSGALAVTAQERDAVTAERVAPGAGAPALDSGMSRRNRRRRRGRPQGDLVDALWRVPDPRGGRTRRRGGG